MKLNHQPIYIPDISIACALGITKEAVTTGILQHASPELVDSQLISGKNLKVATIKEDLPHLGQKYQAYDSRNNRILKHLLDDLASSIHNILNRYGKHRIGVVLSTSTSGMAEVEKGYQCLMSQHQWPNDFHYAKHETGSPSMFASEYLELTGPSYTISTACSGGAKALLSAARLIQSDICDAVLCGGIDTLCQLTLNGFDALDLLANERCLPFSKNRDGITIGEGGALFILSKDNILNSLSPIRFSGGSENSDAYHASSPDPTGKGAIEVMHKALHHSNLQPSDIVYINCHGTATVLNDQMEAEAISRVFGTHVACSSTKPLTGHTLGAAGAVDAAIVWLMLTQANYTNGVPLPINHWDGQKAPNMANINLVVRQEYIKKPNHRYAMMSHSFAFGGSNVSLILERALQQEGYLEQV